MPEPSYMYQVADAYNGYLFALKRVEIRRKEWIEVRKHLLLDRLRTIKGQFNIDAQVQELEVPNTIGAVALVFNRVDSGITKKDTLPPQVYGLDPGSLAFTQSTNGTVSVFVMMPKIEEHTRESTPDLLRIVEPEELDEKLIDELFVEFMYLLTAWHIGS
ncbi:hypothetical protein LLH06_09755 [Mucilaginibacter daejeonensis]|uniref:hypothetical protein n=1 Tax=Mucilaginibacter daejeonensis TaxID=398049 RepID=UPI001D174B05|nr:hypothetical protein [Mucilaginibacter daejeonensis]UEG55243.1 hypothetical protein LLH06_09755 [Mucilaginibacter daejeonensis]